MKYYFSIFRPNSASYAADHIFIAITTNPRFASNITDFKGRPEFRMGDMIAIRNLGVALGNNKGIVIGDAVTGVVEEV